jgi:hypothetical protein
MISGFLTLFQDPTLPLHAATKQYVDTAASGTAANFVPWGHFGVGATASGKYSSASEHWYPILAMTKVVNTTASITSNSRFAWPFVWAKARTIDRFGFHGAIQAGGLARVGIYTNLSDTTLYPDALVVDSGDIDCSIATGNRKATVSATLSANTVYWLVFRTNNNAMTFGIYTASSATNCFADWLGFVNLAGGEPSFNSTPVFGFFDTPAYAALPATFPAGAAVYAANVPLILARFSA